MTDDNSLRERLQTAYKNGAAALDQPDPGERDRGILNSIRMVAGGLIMVLVVTLVLTEVYNAVDFQTGPNGSYTGPFGPVVSTLEGTGVAALTLLVVGFLVIAAGAIMQYFGTGFGGR